MSVSSKRNSDEQVATDRRKQKGNVSATSERACKFRCRRGRETPEEAAGQARAIVDHDRRDKLASDGLIWNHFKFLTQGQPPRQSIDRRWLPLDRYAATKKRGVKPALFIKSFAAGIYSPTAAARSVFFSTMRADLPRKLRR